MVQEIKPDLPLQLLLRTKHLLQSPGSALGSLASGTCLKHVQEAEPPSFDEEEQQVYSELLTLELKLVHFLIIIIITRP